MSPGMPAPHQQGRGNFKIKRHRDILTDKTENQGSTTVFHASFSLYLNIVVSLACLSSYVELEDDNCYRIQLI